MSKKPFPIRLILVSIMLAFFSLGFLFLILDKAPRVREITEIDILIQDGQSVVPISRMLEDRQIIRSALYMQWRFKVLDRLNLIPPLQRGHFVISSTFRTSEIISRITSVSSIKRQYKKLTIPPGFTSSQIARRVEKSGLTSAEELMNAMTDLAQEYPILQTDGGLQGYVFSDTYKFEDMGDVGVAGDFQYGSTAARIIVRTMADRFFEILEDVDALWSELSLMDLHKRIIIASIVEREYRIAPEAPKIAAVFYNRLNIGMPLESCATVVYAIEETEEGRHFRNDYYRFNRRIFEQYLEIPSIYNTYWSSDIPPGPIANPGRTALEAAFNPSDVDSLFFVVKDQKAGTHTFSASHDDHLNARRNYLKRYIVK